MEYLARRLPDDSVRRRWLAEAARTLPGVRLSKRVAWSIGPPNTFKSAYHGCLGAVLRPAHKGGYSGRLPSAYMVEAPGRDQNKLSSELAKLVGARVAIYDETPVGRRGVPPWSSRFVGEMTDRASGISAREMGGRQTYLEGLSLLCAANHLPKLHRMAAPAVLARLLVIPWLNDTPDAEEAAWLESQAGQAECLRAVLDHLPLALRLTDQDPVPGPCADALAEYAETVTEEAAAEREYGNA